MDLSEQVVSLDLAKRLKKSGYPQKESLWWWKLLCIKSNPIDILKDDWEFTYQPLLVTEEEAVKTQDLLNDVRNPNSIAKLYSAPSVAELLTFATKCDILKIDSLLEVRNITADYVANFIIEKYEK